MREAGVTGAHLGLEVTEAALAEHQARAVDVLSALWAAGHRVAIDDFGTGFVSLAHLRRLPIATLKIDTSFVGGLGGGNGDQLVGVIFIPQGEHPIS